jgi:hypothetical protein
MTIRWLAGTDLIAHAIVGRAPRTLCGVVAPLERFAWPANRKCAACETLAKGGAMTD